MSRSQPIFNVPAGVLLALLVLIAIHVMRQFLPPETDLTLVLTLAFIPARYASEFAHVNIPGGALADWTSPVTYVLLHGDYTHLFVNGLWMLAFGSAVAKRVGSWRFLVFSLVCAVGGALTHLAFHFGDTAPVIGASAAISGQMAAAIRFIFSAGSFGGGLSAEQLRAIPLLSLGETFRDPRALGLVGVWLVINVLFGTGVVALQDGANPIAWEAHMGGFAVGLLLFGLFDRPLPMPPAPSQPNPEDTASPWAP